MPESSMHHKLNQAEPGKRLNNNVQPPILNKSWHDCCLCLLELQRATLCSRRAGRRSSSLHVGGEDSGVYLYQWNVHERCHHCVCRGCPSAVLAWVFH
jgi:hypothetical protein